MRQSGGSSTSSTQKAPHFLEWLKKSFFFFKSDINKYIEKKYQSSVSGRLDVVHERRILLKLFRFFTAFGL